MRPATSTSSGWPLPVRPWPLRHIAASLELSGHRCEVTTPYLWATQMQPLIGGNLFTVNDDVHADAPATPDCATRSLEFRLTKKVLCGGLLVRMERIEKE